MPRSKNNSKMYPPIIRQDFQSQKQDMRKLYQKKKKIHQNQFSDSSLDHDNTYRNSPHKHLYHSNTQQLIHKLKNPSNHKQDIDTKNNYQPFKHKHQLLKDNSHDSLQYEPMKENYQIKHNQTTQSFYKPQHQNQNRHTKYNYKYSHNSQKYLPKYDNQNVHHRQKYKQRDNRKQNIDYYNLHKQVGQGYQRPMHHQIGSSNKELIHKIQSLTLQNQKLRKRIDNLESRVNVQSDLENDIYQLKKKVNKLLNKHQEPQRQYRPDRFKGLQKEQRPQRQQRKQRQDWQVKFQRINEIQQREKQQKMVNIKNGRKGSTQQVNIQQILQKVKKFKKNNPKYFS